MNYIDTAIVFREIPDEITLAVNISGCPIMCPNCHSKHLWGNDGIKLDISSCIKLIESHIGISCICFMGGDANPIYINKLAFWIKCWYPKLKIGWYSGRKEIPKSIDLNLFNYIKLGPFIKELGPLNKSTTNQRLYRIENQNLIDITNRFWNYA